jgi:hypothetical protein
MILLKNMVVLDSTTDEFQSVYKKAKPFPRLILDNLFSHKLLEDLIDEVPPMRDESWVHHAEKHLVKSSSSFCSVSKIGPTQMSLLQILKK